MQKFDHNIGFYANFFAENRQKSQKIVIITSTPGRWRDSEKCQRFTPSETDNAAWLYKLRSHFFHYLKVERSDAAFEPKSF
jgi:hypothetical protein